ncbi:hypothetical protein [Ekhidna sp.]|uniref:hypothetical protein n=1 Tax=Ekhidna sp. TaxID=2608089 RepID=UPI0035199956
MGKYPVYAILALIFIGIIKLLQVTAFDAEKYTKNKKASFSKPIETKVAKATEQTAKPVLSAADDKKEDSKTTPLVVEETKTDSTKDAAPIVESAGFEEEKPVEKKSRAVNSDESLAFLKNNYLAPIIAKLPAGQLREDVVIRYYRHDQDGDKVYALKELGYYIHEKEANETAGLGSNVLYYGNDVRIEDIKIVALTLLEKGLPLKSIEPTRFDWKSTSIEIGTDVNLVDANNLSSAQVTNFTK